MDEETLRSLRLFVEANSCWYQASRPMSTGTLKLAPAAWSPGERGYLRSGWLVSVWTRRTVFALGRGREPLVPGRLCDPWFLGIFGGVRGCIRSPTELLLAVWHRRRHTQPLARDLVMSLVTSLILSVLGNSWVNTGQN